MFLYKFSIEMFIMIIVYFIKYNIMEREYMNKKILLFGSIFIVFILMILPSISAVEFNEVVKENESKLKDTILNDIREVYKIRILNKLKLIKNYLIDDIWTILWNIINDIIGAIVINITFKGINALFLVLIPPFVSFPLIWMMRVIEFGVYGAILFDLVRNIINLIIYIITPTNTLSIKSN